MNNFTYIYIYIYIYSKQFVEESDQKSLEMIHMKNLSSQRLQRMLLRIQHYDVKITYSPGSLMQVAYTPSRVFSKNSKTIDFDVKVEMIQFSYKFQQLKEETSQDKTL